MGDRDPIDVSSIGGSFANPNPVPGHALRTASFDVSRYPQSNEDPYDAIVVGGGISGLAALWKLKKAGIERARLRVQQPATYADVVVAQVLDAATINPRIWID